MKIKNCLLLIIPILLGGCNTSTTGSSVTSSSSSEKPFDSRPYSFESETVTLPEDGKVDGRDWIGRSYDITAMRTFYLEMDSVLISNHIFDTEWKYYEVLLKDGAPKYASEDHKPVLEYDSVLVTDLNQLSDTHHCNYSNVDIPLDCYKQYLKATTHLKSDYTTMVYHAKANAIYYTESFPAFDTSLKALSTGIGDIARQLLKEMIENTNIFYYALLIKNYFAN